MSSDCRQVARFSMTSSVVMPLASSICSRTISSCLRQKRAAFARSFAVHSALSM